MRLALIRIANAAVIGAKLASSIALPGTPTIATRPAATASDTQIPDISWVNTRINALASSAVAERGTWTPVVNAGATVTNNYCRYAKVGNIVYLRISFNMSKGTASGIIDITGLPFLPSSTTTQFGTLLGNFGSPANAAVNHGLGSAIVWLRSANSIRIHRVGEASELTFANITLSSINIRAGLIYEV